MDIAAIVVDVAVFIFFLVFAIMGFKKGFFRSLVGIISTVVAVFGAVYFAPSVVKFLEETFAVGTNLTKTITEMFAAKEGFDLPFNQENLELFVTNMGIPSFLSGLVVSLLGDFENTAGKTVGEVLPASLSALAMNAICVVALFLLFTLLLWLVSKIFTKLLDSIPVIGALNRLLGMALELVKALIILYVVLMIVSLVPSQVVQDVIEATTLLKFFRDYNILLWIIAKIPALNEFIQSIIPELPAA